MSRSHCNVGRNRTLRRLLTCGITIAACGCVERTVTIRTEPEGARVFLNDQEVGRSPVKVPFTWYGDYDVVVRQRGYKTLQTHHRLETPWYELPGIDLISECFVPFTIRDDREMPIFRLEPEVLPTPEEVAARADEMRLMALEGGAVPADNDATTTEERAAPANP